ncbi:UNVERIFIED_CONTAM: hypothetical protein K2H54_043453 [Gekko kuhli]
MAGKKGVMDRGRYWVWFLATLQAVSVYGTELSSEACRELGFSSNLLCSSCDLLSQFGLSELDPFCRKCCQEEAQPEAKKRIEESRTHALHSSCMKSLVAEDNTDASLHSLEQRSKW